MTNAAASPAACDPTDETPPGMIRAGVVGSMHGYFIVSGATMQTSNSPYCDA